MQRISSDGGWKRGIFRPELSIDPFKSEDILGLQSEQWGWEFKWAFGFRGLKGHVESGFVAKPP